MNFGNLKRGDKLAVGLTDARVSKDQRGEKLVRLETFERYTKSGQIVTHGPFGVVRYYPNGTPLSQFATSCRILRLATDADLAQLAAAKKAKDDTQVAIKAEQEKREALTGLFPEGWRPTISQYEASTGTYHLEFYTLTETQIRNLAKILSTAHSLRENKVAGR